MFVPSSLQPMLCHDTQDEQGNMTLLSRWLQNVWMLRQSHLAGSIAGSNFPARHISCVVTWPPAFHPLQQGHYFQVLNLLRSHKDLVALSHYAPSWAKASAGCKSVEYHCRQLSRAPPTVEEQSQAALRLSPGIAASQHNCASEQATWDTLSCLPCRSWVQTPIPYVGVGIGCP